MPAEPRFIPGHRAEQLRVKADQRGDAHVIRLDVMQPLTSHAPTLIVRGQPTLIPMESVSDLILALDAVRREHMEGASNDRP